MASRKILILYASAGHGHEKAARALFETFQNSDLRDRVQILDALSLTLPGIGSFYRWVYFSQIKYLPWLWGFFYYSTDVRWVYFFTKLFRRMLNGSLARPLHQFLIRENPSVIITTHFLPTEVAGFLKGRNQIHSRLITVITDYLPHRVWTAPHVDIYAVAAEDTREALVKCGVSGSKIRVTGIPIERKFLEGHSRKELLEKFALAGDRFTVLITGGGAGIGGATGIAGQLSRLQTPVQVLLVCGTNRVLYERMNALFGISSSVRTFGFVGNMQELMEVSDAVVGKGGGLTVTESLAKGKPLILFHSVPGQEKRNDLFVEKHRAGFVAHSVPEVVAKVSEWAANAALCERIRETAKRLSQPRAAQTILGIVRDEC